MASSKPNTDDAVPISPTSPSATSPTSGRPRSASVTQRIRTASVKLMDANPPGGMWSATGQIASKMPSVQNMRSSSYSSQRSRRRSTTSTGPTSISRQTTMNSMQSPTENLTRESTSNNLQNPARLARQTSSTQRGSSTQANRESASTLESAIFMTPSQSPLPVLDNELTEEPEDEAINGAGERNRQELEDLTDDEDVMPAIAMMSREDLGDAASTKSSITVKKKDATSRRADNKSEDLEPLPKRRSKNLDSFLGGDTSKAQSAANGEKRNTRDFADMLEGGDSRLSALFDRDDMNSQSYVRKPKSGASAKPAQPALAQVAPAQAKPSVRRVQAPKQGEDEDEDFDPEAELEEFMREFDDRPVAAQKRSSKTMSQLFGVEEEDLPPGSTTKPGSRLSMVRPPNHVDETESSAKAEKTGANGHSSGLATLDTQPAGALSSKEKETANSLSSLSGSPKIEPDENGVYPNGYRFPPKKSFWQSTGHGLKWFFTDIFLTPFGFLWTLYGLNVVAWGGMLFLLLCNASPWMCTLGDGTYDCNNINSPRRVWVEYDSQILNALFCVTGFGFIPWRFRDLYFLLRWRIGGNYAAWRRLAGWQSGWFRLAGSENQPLPATIPEDRIDPAADTTSPAYPTSVKYVPLLPPTGVRAPPTKAWKMDYVVWAFVFNTFLQAVLSGFMWGLSRYNRPSWSTGLFVGLACVVAALGGIMQFTEGNRVKKVEGVAWEDADREVTGV